MEKKGKKKFSSINLKVFFKRRKNKTEEKKDLMREIILGNFPGLGRYIINTFVYIYNHLFLEEEGVCQ